MSDKPKNGNILLKWWPVLVAFAILASGWGAAAFRLSAVEDALSITSDTVKVNQTRISDSELKSAVLEEKFDTVQKTLNETRQDIKDIKRALNVQ